MNDESITSQVYGFIRDGEFTKAIETFDSQLGHHVPKSRPTLSLLAYCCYNNQDYARSAEFYEELVAICPEEEEYQVYYVQSLVMAGAYHDASRVAAAALSRSNLSPENSQRLRLLYAQSQMELGLLPACNKTLSKCAEEPATVMAMAAVDYTEGKFGNALEKYKIAKQMMGDVPMLLYYMALCRHQMGEHEEALDEVNELIELAKGDDKLEEVVDGMKRKESYIVEAINLKAVICNELKQSENAKDALREMQNISCLDNFDAISMHNEIMCYIDQDPSNGMKRLEAILTTADTFPTETLANLLLLYIKHGEGELAAEIFETNRSIAKEQLSPELYAFIESSIFSFSSPDDAFVMLENLIASMIPKVKAAKRKLDDAEAASAKTSAGRPSTTSIRPATTARILANSLAEAKQELDAMLQTFIPILMLQVKLFWDKKEYTDAEKFLLQHSDYCMDSNDWNLNLGHTLFAQQNDKLEEAIPYYEYVVNQWSESGQLLKAPAVALANLCVAYIMSNENESAENLMKAVEVQEEEQNRKALELDDAKPTYHTCLVNLVIGTLYCSKGNYEFGISRICKSLEPFSRNLCADTWFYTKRCLLSLAGKISKLMIVMDNDVMCDIVDFLMDVEMHGKNVNVIDSTEKQAIDVIGLSEEAESVTVSQEACQLRHLFLKMTSS